MYIIKNSTCINPPNKIQAKSHYCWLPRSTQLTNKPSHSHSPYSGQNKIKTKHQKFPEGRGLLSKPFFFVLWSGCFLHSLAEANADGVCCLWPFSGLGLLIPIGITWLGLYSPHKLRCYLYVTLHIGVSYSTTCLKISYELSFSFYSVKTYFCKSKPLCKFY